MIHLLSSWSLCLKFGGKNSIPSKRSCWSNGIDRLIRFILNYCSLRPDRVPKMIEIFITENLGTKFVEPIPWDLEYFYQRSSPTVPLLFILSPGANPIDEIFKLATVHGMSKRIETISFGQHQEPIAEKAIENGVLTGNWVILQNCHLTTTLEKFVNSISADVVHPKFRLWLTSWGPYMILLIHSGSPRMTSQFPSCKTVWKWPTSHQQELEPTCSCLSRISLRKCGKEKTSPT